MGIRRGRAGDDRIAAGKAAAEALVQGVRQFRRQGAGSHGRAMGCRNRQFTPKCLACASAAPASGSGAGCGGVVEVAGVLPA